MRRLLVSFIFTLAVAGGCFAADISGPPLVDAEYYAPGIVLDMPYATKNNFTGEKLYEAKLCFLRPEVAEALAEAQNEFGARGIRLVMLDCYRPKSISMKMWDIGEMHNRQCRQMGDECRSSGCDPASPLCLWEPLTNYLSRTSIHNTGAAVDVTLMKDGKKLDMGAGFDTFGPEARTMSAEGDDLENRLLLKKIMELHGFRNYYREWWHYDHVSHSKYKELDVKFSEITGGKVSPY